MHFSSPEPSDLAFAMTAGHLPMAYLVRVRVAAVNTEDTGCRFGIFEADARWGGDNEAVNAQGKFCVVFQNYDDAQRIYVIRFNPHGGYHCWTGDEWVADAWRPTGAAYEQDRPYTVEIEKTRTEFLARVRDAEGSALVEAAAPVSEVRGRATADYFALGDLVTDYVRGELAVSSVAIEENVPRPYLEQDMRHSVVRQAPEGRYAMYGGLTRLGGDEIVCVYKVGSVDEEGSPWTVRDETIVWTRSTNGGHSWRPEPELIYENSQTRQENCCGTGYISDEGVFMHPFYILNADYEERAKEENWGRLHLAVSDDGLETWDIPEVETPFHAAASFGGIVELSDGRLLLNCYGAVERGSFRHQAGFLTSHDQGQTWGGYTLIGAEADPDGGPARLNETDIAELPDGRLVSMSRTQYSGFPLYRGVSDDGGETWTVERSALTGLCPALCYTTQGPPAGTLVLAYHDRWGKHANRGGVYLAFSHDGGESWGEPVWISGGAYPCMIETQPGAILCSYYRGHALLRASVFDVPFPTGLHATGGVPGSGDPGIRLQWDEYRGEAAAGLSYRVYRSPEADPRTEEGHLIATVEAGDHYDDDNVTPGGVYFYRVTAHDGDRRLGSSWVCAARAAIAEAE
ncbi:MAG: exo-alpha-sialidase [Armatimonadota bacterium]|nr:exo-alpha-sialidase [Armatimonadota bacterium]